MTAHVRWTGGGEARVLAVGAGAVSLDSSVPSPPGSRIDGTLAFEEGGAVRIRIKVHASRRQADGRFVIEGRPLDLSRETRELLERRVRGA